MKESNEGMTRGRFVAGAVVLPALAGLLLAETATADAGASKAQFKYQSTPNHGQQCSQCRFFKPGSSASANGTCSIVNGSISPKGWCTAFSHK